MTHELNNLLKEKFGYSSFREGQRESIEAVLSGKDTLVMLPTGTGKSLCYQMAGYALGGLTVVVSPLISLMQDQVASLKRIGERSVTTLNSHKTKEERHKILNNLLDFRFIFLSPEMLQSKEVLYQIRAAQPSLFVVDEAHCISQWGMDFRPEYLKLGEVKASLNHPVTMALTATATPAVQLEIKKSLDMEDAEDIIYSVDRPNIKFHKELCYGNKREKVLDYIQYLEKPGIIYFSSKKEADETAAYLKEQTNYAVESYHSDLDAEDRNKVQEHFIRDQIDVICATSAFGMGVDKENIRFVIHYHLPGSPEAYLQEIGRCGRDGKDAIAILLFQPGDQKVQQFFQREALPDHEELKWVYQNNKPYSLDKDQSHLEIGYHFKEEGYSIKEAFEKITSRKKLKAYQLEVIMKYIHQEKCLRSFLLKYFDEDLKNKEDFCCSSCQPDLLNNFMDTGHHKVKTKQELQHWEEILSVIFAEK